ncbi:MAG: tetratricopeptide repeat protein [Lentisphaeria bacterium]|nr:tetratricopeptide repeat protein [Lentisphaeria bacterium]
MQVLPTNDELSELQIQHRQSWRGITILILTLCLVVLLSILITTQKDLQKFAKNAKISREQNAQSIIIKGWELFDQKQYLEAENLFKNCIHIAPGHAEGYRALGTLYMHEKKYIKARDIYRKLTRLYPQNAQYSISYAEALYSAGELFEAALIAEKALEMNDQLISEYEILMAGIHFQEGNKELAYKSFKSAYSRTGPLVIEAIQTTPWFNNLKAFKPSNTQVH